MDQQDTTDVQSNKRVSEVIDICLKMGALAALLLASYFIIQPFIALMLWAFVLAISLYPLFARVKILFRGRTIISAASVTLLMLLILIVPFVWMSILTGMSLQSLGEQVHSGQLVVPSPNESVKSWPLVGNRLYETWLLASTNMEQLVGQYKTQLIVVGSFLVDLIASAGKGIILLLLAIILSGFLLAFGTSAGNFAKAFFTRLVGDRGHEIAHVAVATVKNVTVGIIGVAFIQSILAGTGMFIAGIPLAGLWTLFCLILAVMQIGLLPVSLGVIIYAWTHLNTTPAILLTIWMGFVGIVDNFLKPILLGRKAPVPMPVVLLGTLGGFISSGFIGLFTGAIILSLLYKLAMAWVYGSMKELEDEAKE